MGKGDKRTRKGKIFRHCYENCRKRVPKPPYVPKPNINEQTVKPIFQKPNTNSMGILIEKVRVKNFRSLKNVEVSLTPLTLLVGSNNSGKTSFLKALNLALGVEKKNVTLDDLFIDNRSNRIQGDEGKKIIIDIKIVPVDDNFNTVPEFNENWSAEFTESSTELIGNQQVLMFRTQYTLSSNGADVKVEKFVIRGNWEAPNINPQTDTLTASFEKLPLYFIDAQRDIIDDLRNRTSYFGRLSTQIGYEPDALEKIEEQLAALNEDAVTNSDVMSHLKNKLKELNAALQSNKENVEITPFPKKVRDLHKTMKIHFQDGDSDVFELDYHGMGTRSWASLLAFKAFVSWENSDKNPQPKEPYFPLLALEEPESHLHPNAQRQLYKQLKSIEGQKIISTHSPYIVGLADLEEIRYFCKPSDEVKVSSIETQSFTADEKRKAKREILHSKGELLFSKLVVLCEGETEEQLLPALAANYFDKESFELGVNFIGCGGSNYKMFINIFKTLNVKWVVFSDYDNDVVQGNVQSALSNNDIDFNTSVANNDVILLNNALEKYLITVGYRAELIEACANFINNYMTNEIKRNNFLTQINTIDPNGIIDKEHDGLLKFMIWDKMKAKLASYYADKIINIADEARRFPPKIKQLFEAIETKLNS
jgi:putative ATP-dependent endonuclease of the OLD family